MVRRFLLVSSVTLIASLTAGCAGCKTYVLFEDISPNVTNGATEFASVAAGLTYQLSGSEAALYAVSLNAGVFKSINGGAWTQLDASPRYATAIAVDPRDPAHLVVGERNGDPVPADLSLSGVWESFDAGKTWSFVYSPAAHPECRAAHTQAVPAVFFGPVSGTLFIGTPCGIGRRGGTTGAFQFGASPAGIGAVRAFAVSARSNGGILLWARADDGTTTRLLSSATDGVSWQVVDVPAETGGYFIGQPGRGGSFALAAFGDTVVLDFRPTGAVSRKLWHASSNHCTLLYYNRLTGQFVVQALTSTGDGTGWGGRKHIRSFMAMPERGGGTPALPRLFYVAGQDVLHATGTNANGTLQWALLARARCADCVTTDNVHGDVWDVHYAPDSGVTRLATDGGVYRRLENNWVTHSDGLHTHHIHSLAVVPTRSFPRIAYAVTDNSEWFRDATPFGSPVTGWSTYAILGDGSFAFADSGGPAVAVLARHSAFALATDFGQGMPVGAGTVASTPFAINCGQAAGNCDTVASFGPRTFTVIQTPPGETPVPLLDVVMLAAPPFFSDRGDTVEPVTQGPLANVTSATGAPLLLRNRAFLTNPDPNLSQYAGWEVVASDLPAGADGVWVSGGHINTVYYVTATSAVGVTEVFQRGTGQMAWNRLENIGAPVISPAAVYGPLYLNPNDPSHLFILTADGVRVPRLMRRDQVVPTTPFEVDTVLTALVTNSGQYPMLLSFEGGSSGDVVHASQATEYPKAIVSQIAFPVGHAGAAVVASPVAGLFHQARKRGRWYSLTPYLPRPFTMPSTIGVDAQAIYVGLEGRGIWRLLDYHKARPACFFGSRPAAGPDEVAQLLNASRVPVANAPVVVIVVRDGIPIRSSFSTGPSGDIVVSGTTGAVVHVAFAGDDTLAPCETSMRR